MIAIVVLAWVLISYSLQYMCLGMKSEREKDFEILMLRSQLSQYMLREAKGERPRCRVTPYFRVLMVILSKRFPGWKSALLIVKPETVIHWHKNLFKLIWRIKSRRRPGRPRISAQTIALIKRIHKENPLLSPEKIYEKLVSLNVADAPAPNTIAKYLPSVRKPPSEKQSQSWRTFLKNEGLWSMDFFVVPTLRFELLYVLIIVSHARRRIEHFGVTANPTAAWAVQQIREATPFGKQPKYLLHDNDSIFTAGRLQLFLSNANIKSVRTAYHSPWQNGICERTIGIVRREIIDHIIPTGEKHLWRILHEYIAKYYNPQRTHQGIGGQTPDGMPPMPETLVAGTSLLSTELLGGLYHTYSKAA